MECSEKVIYIHFVSDILNDNQGDIQYQEDKMENYFAFKSWHHD